MAERSNVADAVSGGLVHNIQWKNLTPEEHILIFNSFSSQLPMFSTYILKSQKDYGYYFGHTGNLEEPLKRHNTGKIKSTKSRIPFVIHYCEVFQTKAEAYRRELFFKSFEGRLWLKFNEIIQ